MPVKSSTYRQGVFLYEFWQGISLLLLEGLHAKYRKGIQRLFLLQENLVSIEHRWHQYDFSLQS